MHQPATGAKGAFTAHELNSTALWTTALKYICSELTEHLASFREDDQVTTLTRLTNERVTT